MKERPLQIRKEEDLNSANMEKMFGHYDQLMREIEERLTAVEKKTASHESRIKTLEIP